jgi:hypothetical protein
MKAHWKSTISKTSLTFIILAALLLTGCQTMSQSAAAEPEVEPPVEEPVTLPEPLTEEETMAIFEEVDPMWDTIEYDPADYTDWVEIDCDTTTGEGCLLPNGCDLSTGEGCTLDDGCNFVTLEGCILPNGCNLETGEGCDLFDGCNPVTFEGCPVLEGCDLATGLGCELPTGCNIVTGEGCELPNGCNPLTMEGCTIPYGDGSIPETWDEIDAMWALVNQDWKDADANGQWQEGYYSGLELLGGEGGWENITEEDITSFFD